MFLISTVGADIFRISFWTSIDWSYAAGKGSGEEVRSSFSTEILKLAMADKWQQQCCCYNATALCCSIIRILFFDENCSFSYSSIQPTEPFRQQQPATCCLHHICHQPLVLLLLYELINVNTFECICHFAKLSKKTESLGVWSWYYFDL